MWVYYSKAELLLWYLKKQQGQISIFQKVIVFFNATTKNTHDRDPVVKMKNFDN